MGRIKSFQKRRDCSYIRVGRKKIFTTACCFFKRLLVWCLAVVADVGPRPPVAALSCSLYYKLHIIFSTLQTW